MRSMMLGIGLGLARFFLTVGILFLVAWSYSLWGSAGTPLRHLLAPAIVLIGAGIIARMILREILHWTRRAHWIHHRRVKVREKVRETRAVEMLERPSQCSESNDPDNP